MCLLRTTFRRGSDVSPAPTSCWGNSPTRSRLQQCNKSSDAYTAHCPLQLNHSSSLHISVSCPLCSDLSSGTPLQRPLKTQRGCKQVKTKQACLVDTMCRLHYENSFKIAVRSSSRNKWIWVEAERCPVGCILDPVSASPSPTPKMPCTFLCPR